MGSGEPEVAQHLEGNDGSNPRGEVSSQSGFHSIGMTHLLCSCEILHCARWALSGNERNSDANACEHSMHAVLDPMDAVRFDHGSGCGVYRVLHWGTGGQLELRLLRSKFEHPEFEHPESKHPEPEQRESE
jgi:hypothetical protein